MEDYVAAFVLIKTEDGYQIEVFISPAGQIDGKIKNFRNITKDLGYI